MTTPVERTGRLLRNASVSSSELRNQKISGTARNPAPQHHLLRSHQQSQRDPERRGEHHRHLLTDRLPGAVETAPAGRCDFGKVDRNTAKLRPSRKSLQQTPRNHDQRRRHADRRVRGRHRNRNGSHRHQ
jgi:hypothetical protein